MRGLRVLASIFAVSAALPLAGCSEDPPQLGTPDEEVCLVRRNSQTEFCIDTYEAARKDATETDPGVDEASGPVSLPDRLPWVNVTWAGARDACQKKGKRLCERDEWLDACDGATGEDEGTIFTYGNEIVEGRCNTDGGGVQAGGARADCKSAVETYDQSGNVREWTGNVIAAAAARGGSFRSSLTHECKSGDTTGTTEPNTPSPETGFRCCRDR